ncbi:hypothetical protein FGB62_116g021 [Gracilaria domingensis]|nr:hypothetical protein FGB62_116g021 [Gracilaria domingensis]
MAQKPERRANGSGGRSIFLGTHFTSRATRLREHGKRPGGLRLDVDSHSPPLRLNILEKRDENDECDKTNSLNRCHSHPGIIPRHPSPTPRIRQYARSNSVNEREIADCLQVYEVPPGESERSEPKHTSRSTGSHRRRQSPISHTREKLPRLQPSFPLSKQSPCPFPLPFPITHDDSEAPLHSAIAPLNSMYAGDLNAYEAQKPQSREPHAAAPTHISGSQEA